jgi:flagellar basal-body rod protein FlgC
MTLFGIGQSGLNAADRMLNASASNVANMYSQGYKATRVNLKAADTGGVAVESVTADPSRGAVDENGVELSNVDPATEVVNGILGKTLYTASAKLLRTADQMTGTLLDMFDTSKK